MVIGDQPGRNIDRRRAQRYQFHAELEIEWGSAILRGKTRDISANGMFIEASDTLWVGAGFTACLSVDSPLKVDCFVKRVEPGRGMGVAVVVPEAHNKHRYQQLLHSLSCD